MFKPLNNRVLIRPDKAEQVTSFGIVLPNAKEKPATGTVMVGNELVANGNRVVFSKFGYDEIEVDNELLYVVAEVNLLGIFE